MVIGGGILGASTAHFLAKRGFGKVVLLEKRSLASASTGHSAANVRTYYSNQVTAQLAWRAVQMFEHDHEELGGDSGFRQVGFLLLLDENTDATGDHILQTEIDNGVEVKGLLVEEVSELAPQLNLEGVIRAIYEPRSGYADPVKTTRILVERAKEWGLLVYEGVGATGIRLAGDRVAAVETEQGAVQTPVVVNAAGPWGRQVGRWVGLNDSVRWSRETDLVLRLPLEFGSFPVVSDPGLRFYFRPQDDDKVVAGLGFPKEIEPVDIDSYDEDLDPGSRRRIMEPLLNRVPVLRHAEFVHGWASVYTITDDWHPLVGAEPDVQGYYDCFGGSGHSFKLGPPIGEALADVIAGDAPNIDIRPLRPTRFIEGEPLSSAWGSGNRG
ncbi:MAG: FAD-binding oxidoreductase [Chloroflexi bacterium]|nr:FAD-binding oxidoreductase [Chloroflexota bacterium]